MSIHDEYEARCSRPSDINEHLPRLHDIPTEYENPRILELGVRGGDSTVSFSAGLRAHGAGRLVSVDILMPQFDLAPDMWTFIKGDDMDPFVVRAISQWQPFDVIFIDTSHAYEHTLRELDQYFGYLQPKGTLILHDWNVERFPHLKDEQPYPVREAIKLVLDVQRESYGQEWEVEWHSNNNGLCVMNRSLDRLHQTDEEDLHE